MIVPNLTDSHVHLDMDKFDSDRAEVLTQARNAGVNTFINIALGPDQEKYEKAIELSMNHPDIFLAVGIHPHDAKEMQEETKPLLRELSKHKKVFAIGEIGLDYYYKHSDPKIQKRVFEELLDLALDINLPVSIHSREAFQGTFEATSSRKVFSKIGGVLHCFTGSKEQALKYVEIGAFISFSGILTFKKAFDVREAAKSVPLDRLLIETDAPFLAPEPFRGKRNEPAYVARVAEALAELRGLSVSEIAEITSQNAKKVFRLP